MITLLATPEGATAPRILLSSTVGSRAHGTDSAESDTDIRAVFLQPTSAVVGIGNFSRHIKNPDADENAWELEHFIYLALRNNPFTLECLSVEPDQATAEGHELRALYPHFLCRELLFGAFAGFADQQRKFLLSSHTALFPRPEDMSAYLRVLFNGRELMESGRMSLDLSGTSIADQLAAAERGELDLEQVLAIGERLLLDIGLASEASSWPAPLKRTLHDGFIRFDQAQKKLMRPGKTPERRRSKAMGHYLRVLFNGIEMLKTGRMTVRIVDTEIGDKVLQAKRGEMDAAEALEIGGKLLSELEEARATSTVQEEPDRATINKFLVSVRKNNW